MATPTRPSPRALIALASLLLVASGLPAMAATSPPLQMDLDGPDRVPVLVPHAFTGRLYEPLTGEGAWNQFVALMAHGDQRARTLTKLDGSFTFTGSIDVPGAQEAYAVWDFATRDSFAEARSPVLPVEAWVPSLSIAAPDVVGVGATPKFTGALQDPDTGAALTGEQVLLRVDGVEKDRRTVNFQGHYAFKPTFSDLGPHDAHVAWARAEGTDVTAVSNTTTITVMEATHLTGSIGDLVTTANCSTSGSFTWCLFRSVATSGGTGEVLPDMDTLILPTVSGTLAAGGVPLAATPVTATTSLVVTDADGVATAYTGTGTSLSRDDGTYASTGRVDIAPLAAGECVTVTGDVVATHRGLTLDAGSFDFTLCGET